MFDGGLFASSLAGRRGRDTSSPPQFGHFPLSTSSAQSAQNVHSNEQMRASAEFGGRSLSQHSQPGRSSSIVVSLNEVIPGDKLEIFVEPSRDTTDHHLDRPPMLRESQCASGGSIAMRACAVCDE
jgi:hypothetical protein